MNLRVFVLLPLILTAHGNAFGQAPKGSTGFNGKAGVGITNANKAQIGTGAPNSLQAEARNPGSMSLSGRINIQDDADKLKIEGKSDTQPFNIERAKESGILVHRAAEQARKVEEDAHEKKAREEAVREKAARAQLESARAARQRNVEEGNAGSVPFQSQGGNADPCKRPDPPPRCRQ